MASFRFVLPLLALLASLALGDMCLEYPASIPKGGHCGPSANCKYGYYCDRTSVCVPLLAVNSPCLNSNECETGSCQGPDGSMICVGNANPGEACDTDSSTTTPYCGTGNCFNDVCIGGLPGDSCTNSAACIPGVSCLSGTCSFIEDGSNCTTSQQCLPQSYCNTTGYCVPLKTSGFCDFSNPCADGYECVGMTSGDTFQCMKYGTQDSGLYCQTGRVCKSGRCENNKCAAASLDVCQDNGHCGWDETCTCNNVYMDTNEGYYGKCTKNACLSSSLSYDKCVYSKCKGFSSGYSGACAVVNCGKQLTKVSQCSSSSQLVAPMFTIFLATFMGFFLVKKF